MPAKPRSERQNWQSTIVGEVKRVREQRVGGGEKPYNLSSTSTEQHQSSAKNTSAFLQNQ